MKVKKVSLKKYLLLKIVSIHTVSGYNEMVENLGGRVDDKLRLNNSNA